MQRVIRQYHEETALKIAYALEPYGYQLGETEKVRGQLMTRIEAPYGSANRALSVLLNGTTAQIYLSGRHVDGVRHPGDEDGQKVVRRLRQYGLALREVYVITAEFKLKDGTTADQRQEFTTHPLAGRYVDADQGGVYDYISDNGLGEIVHWDEILSASLTAIPA